MGEDATRAPERRLRRTARALTRPVLFALGVTIAAYFVDRAGWRRIWAIVGNTGGWIAPIAALQLAVLACDVLALRILLGGGDSGRAAVPRTAWIRATAFAHACSTFLPAGRAAGEAVRASVLSRSVGVALAGRAAVHLQACALLATATACAVGASMMGGSLATLLAVSAALSGALGSLILALARSRAVGTTVRRIAERIAPAALTRTDGGVVAGRAFVLAYGCCVVGRAAQLVQYACAVAAVGGPFSGRSAVAADGIQLVASTAGDLLPAQLGALEAAYTAFADTLGVPDGPAAAISLVMIMRGTLVALAVLGLGVAALLPNPLRAP
jgi:hypothetical protein